MIADCRLQIAIADLIRERGPLTVAAFMELALYDPELGYYARAAQRSGRAGDFFTSVDVGPLFGELLEIQIAEMAAHPGSPESETPKFQIRSTWSKPAPATAGCRPTSCAPRARAIPASTQRTRLHLVEASAAARAAQRGDARRRRRSAGVVGRRAARVVRGRADRQRAARRAAGASGRHARGRACARCTSDARRATRRASATRRRPAVDAGARRVSRRLGVDARAGLARRDQPARGRLDPRRGAAPAPRLHHPDRLRPRGARAVLADARRRHADDLRAAHDGAAPNRRRTRRRGCRIPASRTSRRTSISRASARRPKPRA